MSEQQRVTLTNPATRASQMMQHLHGVAQSILTDVRGDKLVADCLASKQHLYSYSIRNRLLQIWQNPDARLIASLGAFDRIAADQGAEAITIKGKPRRVMIAAGARAVWIWGRTSSRRELRDELSGEDRVEVAVQYIPVATWAVEDVEYAATHEPFVLPDHIVPIDDAALHTALLAFAAHKGIEVVHRGIINARGLSSGGRITLQSGDSEALHLPVLAHEIMHELLHHGGEGAGLPKPVVEGEAQAGAGTLLRMYGHDEPVTAAYLRNHSVRPADVLASMDRILRAVGEVAEFIDGRE